MIDNLLVYEKIGLPHTIGDFMPKKCSVKDCFNTIEKGGFGFCGKHYSRFKAHGDVNYVTPEHIRIQNLRNAQPRLGKCKKTTYKKYLGQHEHRYLMEKKLGRKLLPLEHVHHINGDKHDNRIENLVLLTAKEHGKQTAKELFVNRPPIRGARFTPSQVRFIRKSSKSELELSKKFKVSSSLIGNIRRLKIYKYVK